MFEIVTSMAKNCSCSALNCASGCLFYLHPCLMKDAGLCMHMLESVVECGAEPNFCHTKYAGCTDLLVAYLRKRAH